MANPTPQLFQTQRSGGGGGSEEGDHNSSSTSTLPMREGWWAAAPLFRLHGCWLTARLARSVELVQAEFKPRPDDVLLATFPKSGTTWLKALAFALINRSRHPVIVTGDVDDDHHHPLLSSNPHDLVPFLELPDRTLRPVAELEALPSPRLLCTHLPPALLPPGMLMTSSRAVYLCRYPKDVFVSYWHHVVQTLRHDSGLVDFDKAFELFCEGVSVCGPVWEHYLEYWKLSMGNPSSSRVLFLKYEEMMAQPAKHVRKLAEFLGVPFTEEEESGGVVEEVVRLCSFQNLKDLAVNTHGVSAQIGAAMANPVKNSLWFRSGKVGDWKNHLTQEMARRLDCIVEEKLKGSGLTF
ncbi:cytosolic sulfotransferase 5 [Sorghum bicolor]|uniref:cytosolic sulfotransferase 5 n=1 Tax=Sorghum bicolor TaxID=4558 RepID=UPI0001A87E36|nr:cytosolic sulfotransferase 5 [Sorghum bicolor]|eukprot:XP_002444757.1 cytosolic sulfotransferase 5 [Sorghum bicolor]